MSTAKNKKEAPNEAGLVSTSQVITSITYNGEEVPFAVSTKAVMAIEKQLEQPLQKVIIDYNMNHAVVAIRECIKAGYTNRNNPDKAATITDDYVVALIDEAPGTYNNAYLTLDVAWQKFHNIQKSGN
jgi:hypothetical protein